MPSSQKPTPSFFSSSHESNEMLIDAKTCISTLEKVNENLNVSFANYTKRDDRTKKAYQTLFRFMILYQSFLIIRAISFLLSFLLIIASYFLYFATSCHAIDIKHPTDCITMICLLAFFSIRLSLHCTLLLKTDFTLHDDNTIPEELTLFAALTKFSIHDDSFKPNFKSFNKDLLMHLQKKTLTLRDLDILMNHKWDTNFDLLLNYFGISEEIKNLYDGNNGIKNLAINQNLTLKQLSIDLKKHRDSAIFALAIKEDPELPIEICDMIISFSHGIKKYAKK